MKVESRKIPLATSSILVSTTFSPSNLTIHICVVKFREPVNMDARACAMKLDGAKLHAETQGREPGRNPSAHRRGGCGSARHGRPGEHHDQHDCGEGRRA